jgi:hypothetical protein
MFSVHGVNVKQTEIHAAETLVPEPISDGTGKLKRYKSPCIDQIPAVLIKTGAEQFAEIHNLLILFRIRRNCLRRKGINHCTYL